MVAEVWTGVGFSNLENCQTRIRFQKFWNKNRFGVSKSDSGHIWFVLASDCIRYLLITWLHGDVFVVNAFILFVLFRILLRALVSYVFLSPFFEKACVVWNCHYHAFLKVVLMEGNAMHRYFFNFPPALAWATSSFGPKLWAVAVVLKYLHYCCSMNKVSISTKHWSR